MGIRKSQYHFRWDWGPEVKCTGPDRPISLRLYTSRLKEVHTAAKVDERLNKTFKVNVEVEGAVDKVNVELKTMDGKVLQKEFGKNIEWRVNQVELWWPLGHGTQTRYQVTVDLVGTVSNSTFGCVG